MLKIETGQQVLHEFMFKVVLQAEVPPADLEPPNG